MEEEEEEEIDQKLKEVLSYINTKTDPIERFVYTSAVLQLFVGKERVRAIASSFGVSYQPPSDEDLQKWIHH